MAPEELESADPERGAMAPPCDDKPEDDPELLCAVVESSDDDDSEAEADSLVASEAADSDADVVELLEPEAEADAASLLLPEDTNDVAALAAAALPLEDATAEVAEAVELVDGVLVVAAEAHATANAAIAITRKTFMSDLIY
ncbi:hypothetical protein PHYBOEH_011858 [Phytophthora boehmeriae]|uniref:Uncharacterized protein n=1 Tax=Phytophthora boehmeriae TaxID=109152 RepID=A0A8T1WX64_9STRA|nr:hypothetical protein PHYBOEH_011858 [Phytophthora boehmeriae]